MYTASSSQVKLWPAIQTPYCHINMMPCLSSWMLLMHCTQNPVCTTNTVVTDSEQSLALVRRFWSGKWCPCTLGSLEYSLVCVHTGV